MDGATSRMGGATSFPFPALPSRFKSLLNATLCTLLMVLYLDRMCQRGLYAVLWSHIGTLMHRLAAEPCSTAGLLFPSLCFLWNDLANPVFDGVGLAGFKSRANASLLA